MRSRNLKPGFAKNEVLAELSAHTRLLFIQLPMLADREGRLEDRPKRIWVELFPYEPELAGEIDSMLSKLELNSFIKRYSVNQGSYIQIINFTKHQSPHHKEAPSTIPPFSGQKQSNLNVKPSKDQPQVNQEPSINQASGTLDNPTALIPDSLNLIPDSLNPQPTVFDIDPNMPIYDLDYLEGNSLQFAKMLKKLEKLSNFEHYNRNWTHYAHLFREGLTLEDLEKGIDSWIEMYSKQKAKPVMKNICVTVEDVRYQTTLASEKAAEGDSVDAEKASLRKMMEKKIEEMKQESEDE